MLTLWRPYGGLRRGSRGYDDRYNFGNGERVGFTPAVDIEEREDAFVLSADLPGIEEKDVEVKVHDGTLILSGKRESSSEEKTESSYYLERRQGSFCRQFRLGPNVDSSKIEARYKNGVLTISLPKREEAKPRQVPVTAS